MFEPKSVHLVLFSTTREEFETRNKARPEDDIVPAGDMHTYWNEYTSPTAWWLDPKWKSRLTTPEEFSL
jgi:hypothetical protein